MTAIPLPKSLVDNPRPDRWVRFAPDRTVLVGTGKVEIGQGILTALTQIAAEELELRPDRLCLVSGNTEESPDEGTTSGSLSIEVSGRSVRLVCAEVRARFLAHAAAVLGCAPDELAITDGRILRGGENTQFDYWSLDGEVDLAQPVTGSAPQTRDFRVIGGNLPRLDLPAKVSGAAFVHDMAPANVLHARVVRQPARGARLVAVDATAVRRALGEAIRLIREGDFLAIAVDDEAAVMSGVESVRRHCTWDQGLDTPTDAGDPAFLMAAPSRDRVIETGTEVAVAPEAKIIEATYSRPYIAHASMAPSCALARFSDGRLTIWTHSQGPFQLRGAIASVVGLAAEQISVIHRQGAGCYGHNGADDVALDAALVALRAPGQTVRVQWSREDELSFAPYGSAMAVRLRASLDHAGRPAMWTHEIWSGPHGQRPNPSAPYQLLAARALPGATTPPEPSDVPDAVGGGAVRNAVVLYDLPHQKIIHHLLTRLPVRTSSLRGLGAFANVFAAESFVDELADAAHSDPLRYRLAMLSEPRGRRVVETAAAMADWSTRSERGSGRGKGLGFARYKNRAGYCAVVVEAEVDEAVRLMRVWCAVDAGLVINPDGAKNQIEGGIVQAASWTLKEAVRFGDGRVVSSTWDEYPILRFSETPEIDIALIDAPDEPTLGVGEVAHGPTAAAIGNAVAHALGFRLRDLPLNRERIMAALLTSG
jgi:CO/xanthine dehydrogenase Mo-binding subunit